MEKTELNNIEWRKRSMRIEGRNMPTRKDTNNIIQQGNLIVATIGSQAILNYIRKESNQAEQRFYF